MYLEPIIYDSNSQGWRLLMMLLRKNLYSSCHRNFPPKIFSFVHVRYQISEWTNFCLRDLALFETLINIWLFFFERNKPKKCKVKFYQQGQELTISSISRLALSLMGVSWVQPLKVKDVLVAWRRKMNCWALGVWKTIPMAIWRTTWKERYRWIFERRNALSRFQALLFENVV